MREQFLKMNTSFENVEPWYFLTDNSQTFLTFVVSINSCLIRCKYGFLIIGMMCVVCLCFIYVYHPMLNMVSKIIWMMCVVCLCIICALIVHVSFCMFVCGWCLRYIRRFVVYIFVLWMCNWVQLDLEQQIWVQMLWEWT